MTKMMIEVEMEDFNKLRDLCEKINNTDKPVLFPYYTVNTTEMMAVPPYEGDEREFMVGVQRVLGGQVAKYMQDHNMTFDEFKEKAIHTCDYKGIEKLEGFFLTEEACYEYIDDNIEKLKQPYPYCKSLGNNKEMIELVQMLFKMTGVEPSKNWKEPDPVEIIEANIREDAEKEGYDLKEENVKKIARAKNMMFGVENWRRCPCDGDNINRYCGSTLCTEDIVRDGVCHCSLHLKKQPVE